MDPARAVRARDPSQPKATSAKRGLRLVGAAMMARQPQRQVYHVLIDDAAIGGKKQATRQRFIRSDPKFLFI
jgi:hypothetical protein